ncbi:MAG: LysR substrate-binding domain-containing protein [Roseinatronobacter sp.]
MQELKSIRIFLEVAAQRSFKTAARNLRLTPATVTRTIAQLENQIGQQLLVRTTRQVSLTSHGALVAARYGPVVQEFDRVTEELARANRPHRGRLRIAAPMSFGLRIMPGLVDSFRLAYPMIDLQISFSDTLLDIMEGQHDLAIRISEPPKDKSTIWRKLCAIPRHAVAAPCLFQRVARPAAPEDLDPALCLAYAPQGTDEIWRFRKGSVQRNVTAGQTIASNNGDFLFSLVTAGAGIAVLPQFIFGEGLARNMAEIVLPDWSLPKLWLSLHYPSYETLPPLVATFTDFFEAFLRDIEGMDFVS